MFMFVTFCHSILFPRRHFGLCIYMYFIYIYIYEMSVSLSLPAAVRSFISPSHSADSQLVTPRGGLVENRQQSVWDENRQVAVGWTPYKSVGAAASTRPVYPGPVVHPHLQELSNTSPLMEGFRCLNTKYMWKQITPFFFFLRLMDNCFAPST